MKSNQPSAPNKKLIIHFDIENVIRLPSKTDKDFYVSLYLNKIYNLCSKWVWGKL